MKTFRAFGPTIGKTKLSKKIINILNNHVDKTQSSIKDDYSSKLASQIKNEIKIPKTITSCDNSTPKANPIRGVILASSESVSISK